MPESDYTQKAQSVPPSGSGTEPPSGPSGSDPTAAWNPKGPGNFPARIGRYEVRAVLGEGAFGRVYRGFDAGLGREVAIKVPHPHGLTPAVRERFLREARAAAHLHHPNVCPIYDVGTDGDLPFIVMRFIPGGTLADLLAARRLAPPPKFAVATARQLALGVAAAHASGVVHRDLKPQNALWDEAHRQVVITDFGLARVGGETALTGQGDVLGTPSYMAPEQARGDTTAVGPLSDVYSLGVILYRLLTGEPPYQGTVYEIMVQAVEGRPRPPSALRPDLDPALDALCLRAMAVNPAARFQSAKAFADALGSFLKGMEGDEDLPVAEPASDPPRRQPRSAVPVAPPGWVADRPPAVQTRGRTDDPTPRTPPRPAPPPKPAGSGASGVVVCPRCRARMRIGATRTKPVPCPMCDCLFSVAAGRQAAARATGPNKPDGSKARDALPVAELDDDDRDDTGPRPEWRPVAGGLSVAWAGMILAVLFVVLGAAFALLTTDQRRTVEGVARPAPTLHWVAQVLIGLGAAGGLVMIGVGRWRAAAVPEGVRGAVTGRLAGTATLVGTAGLVGGFALLSRVLWYEGDGLPGDPVTTVGQVGCALGLAWLALAEWFHHRQLLGLARRVTDFPYLHAATTRVLLLLAVVPAAVCVVLGGLALADPAPVREAGVRFAGLVISGVVTAAFVPLWFVSALWLTGRAASAVARHAAGDDY